jgi:hypothetical protein
MAPTPNPIAPKGGGAVNLLLVEQRLQDPWGPTCPSERSGCDTRDPGWGAT